MIRLHIGKRRQTTFPKILCDWIGVEPGGDISVHLEKGRIVITPPMGAGILAKYAKNAVNDRRTDDEIASQYAAASDERVQRQAARRRRA
ncbi:hypothetical protein [Cephaloticoccus primus]|uniref:hypothetical protein n=1 Tax=Cephaloticoccus primus TaxID=1548207 RepID=UPI0012E7DB24|nr:hypothetical protein [Cephaloticoccus primus]